MHTKRLLGALALGVGMTLLGLLSVQYSMAKPAAPLYRVAPSCSGVPAPCYTTIQAAVNAANAGGFIHVATGVYTGVQTIVTTPGYTYTQVVIITKSLTLRGGYTTADWSNANPISNPTVIDARRQGRCVTIVGSGSQTVTLEGFTLTGGDYTGLGNPSGVANQGCARTGSDCGGGLLARNVTLILRTMIISNNIGSRTTSYSDGGGAFLWSTLAGSRIENTTFISNSIAGSDSSGGGLAALNVAGLTIAQSAFFGNSSHANGGGLNISSSRGPVLVEATDFISNTASNEGGAIRTNYGQALSFNRLYLQGNHTNQYGAVFYFAASATQIRCTNLILARNSGPSLVYIWNPGTTTIGLAHLTVADSPASTFLFAESCGDYMPTVILTNTLIVSTSTAFAGEQNRGTLIIRHTNTLTRNVTTLHQVVTGTPTFEAINPLGGDPKLNATYHLQGGAAAINAGVDAGVATDIDGEPRPSGGLPDVGADEFMFPLVALTGVSASGPTEGIVNESYTFVATVSPPDASTPIVYTWSPAPASGQGTSAATYNWPTPGAKTLTVTAQNAGGSVTSAPATITIYCKVYLPLVLRSHP